MSEACVIGLAHVLRFRRSAQRTLRRIAQVSRGRAHRFLQPPMSPGPQHEDGSGAAVKRRRHFFDRLAFQIVLPHHLAVLRRKLEYRLLKATPGLDPRSLLARCASSRPQEFVKTHAAIVIRSWLDRPTASRRPTSGEQRSFLVQADHRAPLDLQRWPDSEDHHPKKTCCRPGAGQTRQARRPITWFILPTRCIPGKCGLPRASSHRMASHRTALTRPGKNDRAIDKGA